MNPNSPGFSGSKSYRAVQLGVFCAVGAIGVLAGDFIGDGNGEAVRKHNFHSGIKIFIKNISTAFTFRIKQNI